VLYEKNSQINRGDDYGTLSSAETYSHSRNILRSRLQKVRYERGNSTPYSVRMTRNKIHQGKIVRETTSPIRRSHGGATLENS